VIGHVVSWRFWVLEKQRASMVYGDLLMRNVLEAILTILRSEPSRRLNNGQTGESRGVFHQTNPDIYMTAAI
jgi:hypothetical protein